MLQIDTDRHAFGVRQQHLAGGQFAVELQGPALRFSRHADAQLLDLLAEAAQPSDFQPCTAQETLAVSVHLDRMIATELLPGIQIQLIQASAHAQALARRQSRRATANHHLATPLGQCTGRCGQVKTGELSIIRPVATLTPREGHAPTGIKLLLRRLAERRRQIDRHTAQVGVDTQLAVVAVQGQAQAIRQQTADWQLLRPTEPLAEGIDLHLAAQIESAARLSA